jgi:hypothetical protein
MGLDITACNGLKATPKELAEYYVYINNSFSDQAEGVKEGYYNSENEFWFRAGSYSSYNYWRRMLSFIVLGIAPENIWNNSSQFLDKPFVELIHFSDCEGVIGSKVSAKLAKDFEDHRDLFKAYFEKLEKDEMHEWCVVQYDNWMKAFQLAASTADGVVMFH